MKHIFLFTIISLITLSCGSSRTLSDAEVSFMWQRYHQLDFEESLESKLSSFQRKQIIEVIATETKISPAVIFAALEKKSPDKYRQLFY